MAKTNYSLKADNRPLYDKTIEALNQFIENEGYQPGDRLPGEAELAKQLGVSRPTLREAIGNLEMHGVVKRRHGVGTFVTAPAKGGSIRGGLEQLVSLRALADSVGINAECVDWVVDEIQATAEVARKLEIESGATVAHVQMTAKNDEGDFISYMESFIAIELVDISDVQNYKAGSMLNYVLERGDQNPSYTHTYIYPVIADSKLAGWLKIPEGKPLQLLEETYYSDTGEPIMHEYNYFLADYMDFHIIRRVSRK